MDEQLKKFYETRINSHGYYPDFEELTDEDKKRLKNSINYAGYCLNETRELIAKEFAKIGVKIKKIIKGVLNGK